MATTSYPSGTRKIHDAEATDSTSDLGKIFQSSNGFYYRIVSFLAAQTAGNLVFYANSASTYAWAADSVAGSGGVYERPAGLVITGYTSAGKQPVLVNGTASLNVYLTTSLAAGKWVGFTSAGLGADPTTNLPSVAQLLVSCATTSSGSIAKSAFVALY
jgi:hypothetical protein